VLKQYLGDLWFMAQHLMYSIEMFRSVTHPYKSPAQYIQWRILHAHLFYHFPVNSAKETASVMENAPLSWNHILHWSERPPIEDMLALAKQYEDTLVQDWEDARHQRKRQEWRQQKQANLAATGSPSSSGSDSLHSEWEDDKEGAYQYSDVDTEQEVASQAHNANKCPFKSKKPWLDCTAASTEKTYPYPHNDLVVSHHKPGQCCFACGSEKHWLHECPHYGEYSSCLNHKVLWKEHR
jgi:hypothetical protein